MKSKHLAYFGPEIPSRSDTFVYREILKLRALGATVTPFSLHPVQRDGLASDAVPLLDETKVVCDTTGKLVRDVLWMLSHHPLRTGRTFALMCRDAIRGRFAKRHQRRRLVPQVLVGIAFARHLEACGARQLHIHFAHSPATVGMYAACCVGIPFSIMSRANDLRAEASLLREKVDRSQVFLTISEENRRFLEDELGPLGAKVQVHRCGVETDLSRRRRSHRKRNLIVTAGRLVEEKGVDLLLTAVAPLLAENPALELAIAGDGPLREELEACARSLGMLGQTRFCGTIDDVEFRELLDRAVAFVLPCRVASSGDRDGIPFVLMEAMAAGVPVVSTRVSGIPELVLDQVTGLLAPPESPNHIRRCVEQLLAWPDMARCLSVTGRIFVCTKFDLSQTARRLLDLLQSTRISSAW
jgi:glycosyltransferase involved in cell wall biosynthesis